MVRLPDEETKQGLPYVLHAIANSGIMYAVRTNDAAVVAISDYFYRVRTFSEVIRCLGIHYRRLNGLANARDAAGR